LTALIGSLTSDQIYFYLGRKKGLPYLHQHPSWMAKSARIRKRIEQHQNFVILLFRFVYGVRTITPFLIGVSGVSPLKYFMLNALGALIWAVSITYLGYAFGHAAELILNDIKKYEYIIMGIIVLVSLAGWLLHLFSGIKKGTDQNKIFKEHFDGFA